MKKIKSLLILIVISLIPLAFTITIPYALPTSLSLDTPKSSEHIWDWEIKLYTITFTEGSQYTIVVNIDLFWELDISLRIADTPYMINGFLVDSSGYTGEVMHFTPSKSGIYYIHLKVLSGSGFYTITVKSGATNPATGQTVGFFDISYLLVLILPSLFIFAVGLIILIKKPFFRKERELITVYDRIEVDKKETLVKKEELMICPYCGCEIKKNLQKCPECDAYLE